MKVTNGELYGAAKPLNALLETKLPLKVSHAIAKLAVQIEPHVQVVEKVRVNLLKTYGTPDPDNPQVLRLLPDNPMFDEAKRQVEELMATEVEIDFSPIAFPEEQLTDLSVEPVVLIALTKFVTVT